MPNEGTGGGGSDTRSHQYYLRRAAEMLYGVPSVDTLKPEFQAKVRHAADELAAWDQKHGSLANFPGFGKQQPNGGGNAGNGGNGNGSGGPSGAATAEPHGNVAIIVQFLRGKGLPDAAIAGILGNFQVESGFNPTAYNAGEGAIGLGQWEGGRRTALQQWAAAHGGSETDLQMQLGYMWHELQTGYSGVLSELRNTNDAGAAAAYWDAHYEISSGAARATRVNNAISFFNNGLNSGGVDSSNAGGGPAGGGGNGSGGNGGVNSDANRVQLGHVAGGLGNLLDSVPELRHLVDKALAQGWGTAKFENAVQDSDWWKNHSQTARSVLITQANDPATYQQDLTNAKQSILAYSHQLGMDLNAQQVENIANSALLSGNTNNQQWIAQQISRREDYSGLTSTDDLKGGMAATVQQLQQISGDYGINWSPQRLAEHAQNVLAGGTTLDTYKQRAMTWAQSAFPGLAKQIQGGATVRDLSDPYVSSMSQLLEVAPDSINLFTPLVRQAMQGTAGKDGVLSQMPLDQFEKLVRQDPRWSRTQNAKDTMSTALIHLGADFGFGPAA